MARDHAGDAETAAVVKANGYGNGIRNIVPTLTGMVDWLAVATIDEGIRCRELTDHLPIIVFSEFLSATQLDIFYRHRLQPVVYRPEQVQWLLAYNNPLSCWLKFDSGMNRLGFNMAQIQSVFKTLSSARNIIEVGVMSHLASADETVNLQTVQQIEQVTTLKDQLVGQSDGSKDSKISLANSAGLLQYVDSHFDMVRPGLLLYGVSPIKGLEGKELGLEPVMHLEARIMSVKSIEAGQVVGYNASFVAPRKMRIGVVGFGYGDGYPRCVSNRGYVCINAANAPVIGKVSMDMMTVDLEQCPDVKEGDVAELWGKNLPVERVAEWADTIPYELLCRVSGRVARRVNDGQI